MRFMPRIGSYQRNRLTTVGNGAIIWDAKQERDTVHQMRKLRSGNQEAKAVETVLHSLLQVPGLGTKTPPVKVSRPRWTMKELESLSLPVFSFGDERDCVYCGDPATERDHVIAVSYQTNQKRKHTPKSHFGPWCWSCSDCNRHLSNRYFDSFKERCEWAHWRLARKTQPIEWHQWELDKLDYTLRTYIRKQIAKRLWMQQRADWYETRDFYLNLESLIWKLNTMEETGPGAKFLRSYFSSMLTEIARIYELRNTL